LALVVDPASAAIVNAANPEGLSGGGVDGAITAAGGMELAAARRCLPLLCGTSSFERPLRIATGGAVMTARRDGRAYGKLHCGGVIHAVGPDFGNPLPKQSVEQQF
jgi:O-acetyl-ADP-ribose deacetylase (regulator of RNase III)